jgi:ComF family protein
VFRYENREENAIANEVIYSLKQDNRADVCDFLASEIARTLEGFMADRHDVLFTNVPRRTKAVLDYGMDHAAELAMRLARHFGCEYRSLLVSKAKKAQKTTHGAERERNVVFDYKRRRLPDLTGRTVIIVDDIVTTGASVSTVGALVRALGAKTIIAVSVAATYKDKPSPLRKTTI